MESGVQDLGRNPVDPKYNTEKKKKGEINEVHDKIAGGAINILNILLQAHFSCQQQQPHQPM